MPVEKAFHWSVMQRDARKNEARQDLPYRGTTFSKVLSPQADVEQVTIDSVLGPKTINYAYPFASTNAWIRGQPEVGTTMISVIGGDSRDVQPIAYYDSSKATAAATYSNYAAQLRSSSAPTPNIQPYRTLTPGDLDIASNFAQVFLGLKDVFQARGGLSHLAMTSLRARLETPLFEVLGPAHSIQAGLNDEVRFGTVRRATPTSNPSLPSLVRGISPSTRDPTALPFAKEHSVVLNWFGLPNTLIDHRQGNVVDDQGIFARATKTQRSLRALFRWFSFVNETRAEIDEAGNWFLGTSLEATDGGTVEVPTGSFTMDVGQRMNLRAKLDVEISSLLGFMRATATTGFRVATPAIGTIEALSQLTARSAGTISIDTPVPLGIQLGTSLGIKYPILVGNPVYLDSLQDWYSAETALNNLIETYGTAAGAAWAAIGALAVAIDPTTSVPSMCESAAAAAAAMAAGAASASFTLGMHMPTLAQMPAGFVSAKTISE